VLTIAQSFKITDRICHVSKTLDNQSLRMVD